MELTSEQEFQVRQFQLECEKLTDAETKELLIETIKQSMIQHNNFKAKLAKKWGIST